MDKLKSIGVSGYYLDPAGIYINHTAFGSKVAATDLLKALLKYTSSEEICFSYIKDYYNHVATDRLYRKLLKTGKTSTKVSFIDRIGMLQKHKKLNSDIIHDFGTDFFSAVFLREYFSTKRPPITYTLHCASFPTLTSGAYLVNLFSGLKNYDSMICTSKAVKSVIEYQLDAMVQHINQLYSCNLKYNARFDLIPLGIDDETMYRVDKSLARKELNIEENAFVILYFGRVSAFDKGDLLPLLKVFKGLVKKNNDKKLVLVIAGTDYEERKFYPGIESYIQKMQLGQHVKIFKKFDYSKRNYLYSTADVYTSPIDSIQETFGLTPIEAMACGVPQIVSDWNGYRDTVRHGETGFRIPTYWSKCDADISAFPPGVGSEFGHDTIYSHFTLSQSVALDLDLYEYYFQQLINNPEICGQLQENSLKIFKQEYTLRNVIHNYESLWNELREIKRVEEEGTRRNFLELFNNRYSDAFASYPTRFIHDEERIAITQDGKDLLEGKEPYPEHYKEEKVLNEFLLGKEILTHLLINQSEQIRVLVEKYKDEMNENVVRRSIMWLLKHRFVVLIRKGAIPVMK